MRRFDFRYCYKAYEFCNEIVDALIELFNMTEKEALNLINERWGTLDLSEEDDIMYHEVPRYWAVGMYFKGEVDWRKWEPIIYEDIFKKKE